MILRYTISAPNDSPYEAAFNELSHPVRHMFYHHLELEAGPVDAIHILLLRDGEAPVCRLVTRNSIGVYLWADLEQIMMLDPFLIKVRICELLIQGLRIVEQTFQYGWEDPVFRHLIPTLIEFGNDYRCTILPNLDASDGIHSGSCTIEWTKDELSLYSTLQSQDFKVVRHDLLFAVPSWNGMILEAISHKWKSNSIYFISAPGMWKWSAEISTDCSVSPRIRASDSMFKI